MRKLLALILILVLSMSLTACLDPKAKPYEEAVALMAAGNYQAAAEAFEALEDYEDATAKALDCRYEQALASFEQEDFAAAKTLFEKLSGHKDSAEMAEKCRREIGMRENADYAFLVDLESTVTNFLACMDDLASDEVYGFFEEELDLLEKYEKETFFDENLHELAINYIDATEVLQTKASRTFWGDKQEKHLEGTSMRFGVLTKLYHEYGFMEDNEYFLVRVVNANDRYQKAYAALAAVRGDLMDQLKNADIYSLMDESTGTFTLTVTNNSEHSYSAVVLLNLMDVRNSPLQNSNVLGIKCLEPGESCDLVLKNVENAENFWHFEYNTIIAIVDNLDVGFDNVYEIDPMDEEWQNWYPDLIIME